MPCPKSSPKYPRVNGIPYRRLSRSGRGCLADGERYQTGTRGTPQCGLYAGYGGRKADAVDRPTKGSIEAEVTNAVARFQREQQGRGATEVRAHIVGDLILVRCGGIFTPTETRLAATEEGCRLIKSAREELRLISRAEIENILAGIVGCAILRSYYDVDVESAEQVEVYVLERNVERQLAGE